MLNLKQDRYKQIQNAILSAYPHPSDLNLFVSEQLGENLAAIAGDLPHEEAIAELVRWAIDRGKIDDLAAAISDSEPAWWEKIAGIFANDPAFDRAMEMGREYRQSLMMTRR